MWSNGLDLVANTCIILYMWWSRYVWSRELQWSYKQLFLDLYVGSLWWSCIYMLVRLFQVVYTLWCMVWRLQQVLNDDAVFWVQICVLVTIISLFQLICWNWLKFEWMFDLVVSEIHGLINSVVVDSKSEDWVSVISWCRCICWLY